MPQYDNFEQRLASIGEEKDNPYQKLFGLKSNPFPQVPVVTTAPTFCCDQEELQENIFRYIENTLRSDGKKAAIILKGEIGDGKTHLLRYFENRINEKLSETISKNGFRTGIGFFVDDPGNGMQDIFRKFMEWQKREFWNTLGCDILKYRLNAPENVILYLHGAKSRLLEEEIEEVKAQLPQWVQVYESHLYQQTMNWNLAKAFAGLINNLDEDYQFRRMLCWNFLTAGKIGAADARRFGFSTSQIADIEIVDYFTGVLKIIGTMYRGIFIFIDELENVTEMHRTTKHKTYIGFTKLLNVMPENVMLTFGCDTEAVEWIKNEDIALARRFTKELLIHGAQDEQNAREYLTKYLAQARPDDESEDKLSPFTEESFRVLHDTLRTMPLGLSTGEFLKYCGHALQQALDDNKSEIDVEIIQKIFLNR